MQIHCAYRSGTMHVRCSCGCFTLVPTTIDAVTCRKCRRRMLTIFMPKKEWTVDDRGQIRGLDVQHDLITLEKIGLKHGDMTSLVVAL